MASLSVEAGELVLSLSPVERVEGLHGSIRVPASAVRAIRSVVDPWSELRGVRAPGTGVPGVLSVGTRRGGGVKDFVVVHGHSPAVLVEMEGAEFDRFVITAEDASAVASELCREIGLN